MSRQAEPAQEQRANGTEPTVGAEYLSLRSLAVYSGLSVRKLRDHLVDGARPLPHYRIGGKLLVRRCDFDEWAMGFRVTTPAPIEQIVDEIMEGL